MRTHSTHGIALVLLITCAGCSSNGLVEVSGDVTLDDQPIQQGTISFWPADGKGPSAGILVQDGKYRGMAAPGAKKVTVDALKQVGEVRLGGPESPLVPVHKPLTPETYRDPQKTNLRCEVSPTAITHSFHLKSS